MKYINKFQTSSEYNSFVDSKLYVTPNISHIAETSKNEIHANDQFTINGTTYNFQEGMTWQDWITHPNQSYYSHNEWEVENTHMMKTKTKQFIYYENNANFVRNTDYILPGQSYILKGVDPDCIIFYTTLNNLPLTGFTAGTLTNDNEVVSNTVVDGIGQLIFRYKVTSIQYNVFISAITKFLTSLRLPDSVEYISASAFSGSENLITVDVGLRTFHIGSNAFSSCPSLVEVNLSNSVRTIENQAFKSCTKLKRVRNCASLLTVGDQAFGSCTNLEDIDLHNVINIGTSAFASCTKLKNAYLTNIENLGGSAFYHCASLKNVVLGDKLTTLNADSFKGCSGLENMTIGSGISSCSTNCFGSCTGKLTIKCTTPDFSSASSSWFYGSRFHEINIQMTSVGGIGSYTFAENSYITKVVIDGNCQNIGSNTFEGCMFLSEVIIGNGVRTIQDHAFYDCNNLSKLSLGQQLIYIGPNAFQYCNITSCVIPDSVQVIGNEAFMGALGLEKVHIGTGVRNIGDRAFAATSIDTVILPSQVSNLGTECFELLDNLFCLASTPPLITDATSLIVSNGSIFTPSSVVDVYKTSAGWSVYADRLRGFSTSVGRIVEYKTNDGQPVIPSWPFASNSYTDNGGQIRFYSSSSEIPSRAFEFCENLIEATIPAKITTMGHRVFYNCKNLTKLYIPNGVLTIGNELCVGCSRLESVRLPDDIRYLGFQAFVNCKKLTDIYLGANLPGIEDSTFFGCESLQNIILPPTILTIVANAFTNCTSLSKVYCLSSTPPNIVLSGDYTTSSLFATVNTEGPFNIIVPDSFYNTYANDANWRTYASSLSGSTAPIPFRCIAMNGTADSVPGNATTALITCKNNAYIMDRTGTVSVTNGQYQVRSKEFPRNMSNESIIRQLSVSYLGASAPVVVEQQAWVDKYYTVDLNGQWQKSTKTPNPEPFLFEGVYESFSNKGVNNKGAIMYIDIAGYSTFKLFIRSYGENLYDYVMVSNLDTPITNTTAYNSSRVYAHTYGKSTDTSSYMGVKFTNIDKMPHRITIVYRKDSSTHSGNDRGYVCIPYQYEEEPS